VHWLRLPARVLLAIKCVPLIPDYYDEGADEDSGGVGEKLVDVRRELEVLRGLCASMCWAWMHRMWLYVDLVEDALWIWIERSLADMVGLMEEGLRLQEPRIIALLMSDVSFFFFRSL
jgi:hypothetical protein